MNESTKQKLLNQIEQIKSITETILVTEVYQTSAEAENQDHYAIFQTGNMRMNEKRSTEIIQDFLITYVAENNVNFDELTIDLIVELKKRI